MPTELTAAWHTRQEESTDRLWSQEIRACPRWDGVPAGLLRRGSGLAGSLASLIRQLTSVFRPGISWSTCPISACWMPSLMASLGRDPARRGVSGKTLLRRSRTPHQLVSFIISQRWAPAGLGSLANILLPPPGSSLMTLSLRG